MFALFDKDKDGVVSFPCYILLLPCLNIAMKTLGCRPTVNSRIFVWYKIFLFYFIYIEKQLVRCVSVDKRHSVEREELS